MAITDNTFTPDELEAAIAANPALLENVRIPLEARKYVVQDETTHQNYLRTHEEGFAKTLTKKHAETIEKDVFDITGIEKLPDEKYFDYTKRAMSESIKDAKEMRTELEQLRKGVAPDATQKARIKELEAALIEKDALHAKILNEKESAILSTKIETAANVGFVKLSAKYKADVPAELVELAQDKALQDLMKIATLVDGKLLINKEDGTPILDPKTYAPITAEQYFESHKAIASLIDPSLKNKGAGTGAAGNEKPETSSDGTFTRLTSLPATVKTKVELTTLMLKMGYTSGTKEMTEDFGKFGKDLQTR